MKLDREFAEKLTKLQQDGALTDTELDSVTGGVSTAANRNLSRIHRVVNLKKKKNSTEDSTD